MSGEVFWVLSALCVALLLFGESRYHKSGHAIGSTKKPAQAEPIRPTTFPVMDFDNITPNGQAITAAQAVKVFRLYMRATGFLDKQELPDHARYFSEDLKRHGEDLADRVNEEKCKFREYSELIGAPEIRSLKRQLLKTNADEKRRAIEAEIAGYQSEIDEEEKYLHKALAALQAFRADKRQFTVDYINNLTQRRGEPQTN